MHRAHDQLPLLMLWRAINAGLATISASNDPNQPALKAGDEGFNEIVTAIRCFNRAVLEPISTDPLSLILIGTAAIYRVPIFISNVTVNQKSYPIAPVAGIVIAPTLGEPIVIGSEGDLRNWIERYRLSWFVTCGLVLIIFGFFFQLIATIATTEVNSADSPTL